MSPTSASVASFVALHLCARDRERAERAVAEAYAAGAVGAEEREDADGPGIVLYAPLAAADAVRDAATAAGVAPRIVEPVVPLDWLERWKQASPVVEISPRLCIRPSFRDVPLQPGQHVVVIDPGQAFGTGGHQSTRMVLEWIDELLPSLESGTRLLDVGTGSGVLSIAAAGLAPVRAVACDRDPLAGEAARENARRNAVADRVHVFVGGIEAIAAAARFALVVANLLRRELEPVLPAIASRLAPRGALVVAGLVAGDVAPVRGLASAHGLATAGVRAQRDASGETWVSLLMRPSGAAMPGGGRG